VNVLLEYVPWLLAMGVLLFWSAFFSASEAALFYLPRRDRRAFETGHAAQRVAAGLLADPDRLLTAVLFWNLLVNVVYFTLAAIVSLRLQTQQRLLEATWFSGGALLVIILLGEMLPKSLGVYATRSLAVIVALPLSVAVRVVEPMVRFFRRLNVVSQRLLVPHFRPEPYLEVADLERAVVLSTGDAALLRHEEAVLQNILLLSELRADELMRPRTHLLLLRPPVSLASLRGAPPGARYAFVTEPDSDEIAAVLPLSYLLDLPDVHLQHYAEPVLYVPWCTTAASVLEQMRRHDQRAAAVVNEFGETIGVVTLDDLLHTLFSETASRSARLQDRAPVRQVRPDVWQVTGLTSLRRLERYFDTSLPPARSVTVSGILQELLGRVPQPGDECTWGPFALRVVEAPQRGQLLVELTRTAAAPPQEASS
jgi:putative hemolysin